jgi:hypothetical protein
MVNLIRRFALAGTLVTAVGLLATAATASATSGGPAPQHRQIAVATLSDFQVVITATRVPGFPPAAKVTAAGYRRVGSHWKLMSVKRIGGRWFWGPVETCSLTTTQLRNFRTPPLVQAVRTITVSLLITPALGCSGTFSESWKP